MLRSRRIPPGLSVGGFREVEGGALEWADARAAAEASLRFSFLLKKSSMLRMFDGGKGKLKLKLKKREEEEEKKC